MTTFKYVMEAIMNCLLKIAVVLFLIGAILLSAGAHAKTAKIGIFVDTADITVDQAKALLTEANTIFSPTGVRLEFASYEVIKPSAHSNPAYVLDDVIEQRLGKPADVYVLLTYKTLMIGSKIYAGYANNGPACTDWAAAVVTLWQDGTDARTLAHEIAHTFGATHDAAPGWLMAAMSHHATDIMSADTIGVIKGSYLDCMLDPVPVSVTADVAPAGTTGGGGSTTLWFILTLAALFVIARAAKM